MIDKNYLGHDLTHCTEFYPKYDYKCNICGIILYYDLDKDDNYTYQYNLCEDGGVYNYKCILTCEEFIIKNILE